MILTRKTYETFPNYIERVYKEGIVLMNEANDEHAVLNVIMEGIRTELERNSLEAVRDLLFSAFKREPTVSDLGDLLKWIRWNFEEGYWKQLPTITITPAFFIEKV